jgi:hypothetical protein
MRILLLASLCLPLLTTGCFVGDGVAHVVKLANKSLNSLDGGTQQTQAPQSAPAEVASAPVDRDPAPLPAAAPRDQIKVEELPPKL